MRPSPLSAFYLIFEVFLVVPKTGLASLKMNDSVSKAEGTDDREVK